MSFRWRNKARGIYLRTKEGRRAWASPRSGLPDHYRQILGLMTREEIDAAKVLAGMRPHSERQILDWLEELDTLGFITLQHMERQNTAREQSAD